jgi:hypothetical protein
MTDPRIICDITREERYAGRRILVQPTATVVVWLDDDDRGTTPRTPNIMHRMQSRQQRKNGTRNGGLKSTCRDAQAKQGPWIRYGCLVADIKSTIPPDDVTGRKLALLEFAPHPARESLPTASAQSEYTT